MGEDCTIVKWEVKDFKLLGVILNAEKIPGEWYLTPAENFSDANRQDYEQWGLKDLETQLAKKNAEDSNVCKGSDCVCSADETKIGDWTKAVHTQEMPTDTDRLGFPSLTGLELIAYYEYQIRRTKIKGTSNPTRTSNKAARTEQARVLLEVRPEERE
jgi:hypothetical protein